MRKPDGLIAPLRATPDVMTPSRIPSRTFRWAAIYGLIVLLPLYLSEPVARRTGAAPFDHPELLYGSVGTAAAMQLIYWTIGSDPPRYRALMPIAVVAKLSFFIPVMLLALAGRVGGATVPLAALDGVLAGLFLLAWRRTPTS